MVKGVKDFVIDAKKIIKKEKIKINELHEVIAEYEALICVIGQTEAAGHVKYYREKINQCYSKIESSLENIKNSQDRIATMKAIDKIIKRSERNA